MDPCTALQVSPHKLSQIVTGSLIPEPVTEPPGLVGDQNDLIISGHALICYSGKVPGCTRHILQCQTVVVSDKAEVVADCAGCAGGYFVLVTGISNRLPG